ncbi:hypothetical protein [Bradyrhizobium japonicum]|uniref:hypothetical protein n=2 Tax=Bradyrhizobium japonicum TaxID=375 RepID=UPI000456C6D7|nr:hypothetical protein [Bradyrhizobium japonicum]AHY50704.1 hypothetical protein BJS_08762 [Bradyrhizobium japonicum SEMIA 5079]MBR0729634.1 hypothetical protein [Bradyrhizobium japonicum]MCD9104538.1 hypothetical protein [Bradyrhizobium japonicum]MCD9258472.1 hypothetical protein [Bradyrhizobium japonicum SEMIA 5079]MCD9909429.1 hypothetical protein [Bradyrhizobium japonicum]
MKEFDPFGIKSPTWAGGVTVGDRNYLNIEARAVLVGTRIIDIPFLYNVLTREFVPHSIPIKWNDVSEIKIPILIDYKVTRWRSSGPGLPIPVAKGVGSYDLVQSWAIKYVGSDVLLEAPTLKDNGSASSKDSDIVVSARVETTQWSPKLGLATVKLLVKLSAGETRQGATFGLQVGGQHASAGVSSSPQTTTSAYSKDYELKVSYLVTDRPKPSVEERFLRTDVYFAEDKDDLLSQDIVKLRDEWYYPMTERYPALSTAVREGKCPITLIGYASDTGPANLTKKEDYNVKISRRRIDSVANGLRKIMDSDKIAFQRDARGQADVTQRGAADQEKRVRISIDRGTADGLISQGK